MLDPKPWYQSRGVLGSLVAVIAGIAAVGGYAISEEEQATLTELLLGVASLAGGLIAWVGRVEATRPVSKRKSRRTLNLVPLLLACSIAFLLAGCAGSPKRNLYAEVELGIKAGFDTVAQLAALELDARAACRRIREGSARPADTGTCKPEGTYLTKAQGDKANETLAAAKTAARLAQDTVGGCVQPRDGESAKALERLGLSGCMTSDQVLVAALAATQLLRKQLEANP